MIGALFIDFRKAIDLVDHSILMQKLAIYKFSPLTLQWFGSYQSHRQQAIESDKVPTSHLYARVFPRGPF